MTQARGFPAFPPRPGRRGRSWWARAFVAALEDTALDAGLLRRGRRFAGSGRVGPITVSSGRISAAVDDPDGIVEVTVHLATLTAAEWERFLDQVAEEAGHLAALLDGEVPRSLVQAADAAGVPLLPMVGDLESACDCPDVGDPCQHAAALCYQAAWLLDEHPSLLLLLRGHDGAELVDAVGAGVAAAGRTMGDAVRSEDAMEDATEDVAGSTAITAALAYAAEPAPLPPPAPMPVRFNALVLPAAPGLPEDELSRLATAAAARARALLAGP